MIIIVMGVAGAGKTLIGTMLAEALRCSFLDADTLHPETNVQEMSRGVPLTDVVRAPWLASIHAALSDAFSRGESIVVACSALKRSYRRILAGDLPVTWVYLKGAEDLILMRLQQRVDHFFRADLLASQVEELEEPAGAIVADVSRPPSVIVERILSELRVNPDVRVSTDGSELSFHAAEAAVEVIGNAVAGTGRCSVVLSGGSTPRILHRLLASRFREQIPWSQLHLFWGDERYVPHDDALSNYRMAKETLLDQVPCPADNIHPMPTHLEDPDAAAREYEAVLRSYFDGGRPQGDPRFDLVFLGLGDDGHTASLFPGSSALKESVRWVLPVTTPAEPPLRLTLTLALLTRSANTYFLVTGQGKAREVGRVLTGSADPGIYPAAAIQLGEGKVIWWLDPGAATRTVSGAG